ncbi:hypothetical protein ABD91_25820 [Lysinibacillus sphaericus]|uniref:hypothetical protein n=1 Tax=Lysinibacillus sphaericus TaxID=1421 RepID=UPI0018CD191A|nr:hypothetical protein [Lysinibacillus sphaericus]MBG9694155.1 hypothetical protein [Lysinibacillus sphaericus]
MSTKLIYNETKTQELVEEMKQKGHITSVSDLSKMIRQSGVIVRETIGRKRSFIEVSPKMYGVNIDDKEEDTRKFFKEHVRKGKLSFIPDSYDKKLTNSESKVRIARRRSSIGYDEKFMTMEEYNEFQKKFDKWKEEYFQIRDEIVLNWDSLIREFKRSLEASLNDLNSLDKATLTAEIMQRIPSKEDYEKSFYMNLILEAFPVADNLSMFTPEVQESMRENVNDEAIRAMYQMITASIDSIFIQTSKIIRSLEDQGTIHSRTINQMSVIANQVRKNNIIDNDVVYALAELSDQIGKRGADEGLLKELLLYCVAYADELSVIDDLTWIECPLTSKEAMEKINVLEIDIDQFKQQAKGNSKNIQVVQAKAEREVEKVAEVTKEDMALAVGKIYEELSLSIHKVFYVANKMVQEGMDEVVEISNSYLETMLTTITEMKRKNIINDTNINKMIDIAKDLCAIDAKNVELLTEKAEELVGFVYYISKLNNIHNEINLEGLPYDQASLEEMIAFLYE